MNLVQKVSIRLYFLKTVKRNYLNNRKYCANEMDSTTFSSKRESWRGVPMTEILGAQSTWTTPEFPMVSPSHNHSVLYHLPNNTSISMDTPPKPQIGQEKWDHDFVRMPFSNKSLYPIVKENGDTELVKRWPLIQEALRKPIHNSQDLAAAILSYNSRNKWSFRCLHKLFNKHIDEEEAQIFFDLTLPEIIKLALDLPKLIQSPIPLLRQQRNHSISLSQQQIASLLANAFLCTFPRRNGNKRAGKEYSEYPNINFSSLYEASPMESVLEKLKCICHYFRRVCTQVPVGTLTFVRRHVAEQWSSAEQWAQSDRQLAAVPIHVDSGTTIEDAHGLIQFDFANKYLGGGVLGHGCVQEEIRFVICPELLISMLFTEMLGPDEALIMIGCERYSNYTGYGDSFQFAGDYRDQTLYDSSGRRRCVVLAVDALPFRRNNVEFQAKMIVRELKKAWVGVSFDTEPASPSMNYPGVATGNWGCGAFGGTPRLKALLQLMACAQARRPLAYYTFGDVSLRDDIVDVYNVLTRNNVTVGELFEYLVKYSEPCDVKRSDLYTFLHQVMQEKACKPKPKLNACSSERMDTSNTQEALLTSSLEQTFCNNSPDMFSQENSPVPETPPGNETKPNRHNTEPSLSINGEAESKPSLFEQMQRFDEENCKLNLTNSRNSAKRESVALDVSMESDEAIARDSPKHVKKKVCNPKITDYFNKKST